MSGMQVDTVKKVVSNSSGAGGVSLSTLRRAEDDDSDAPMKRKLYGLFPSFSDYMLC